MKVGGKKDLGGNFIILTLYTYNKIKLDFIVNN